MLVHLLRAREKAYGMAARGSPRAERCVRWARRKCHFCHAICSCTAHLTAETLPHPQGLQAQAPVRPRPSPQSPPAPIRSSSFFNPPVPGPQASH